MDGGCLPMFGGTEDTGCQTIDETSEDEELDEEEDWCLEQIEIAYKKVNLTGQLAQYEMRRGLEEVVRVYGKLCLELGVPRLDNDGNMEGVQTTKEKLLAYKPLMDGVLRKRVASETTVKSLCVEIARKLPFEKQERMQGDPFYREVISTANYTPKPNGVLKMTTVIPKGNRWITVHKTAVEALQKFSKRFDEDAQGEKVAVLKENEKDTAKEQTPLSVWDEAQPLLESMNLLGSEWETKLTNLIKNNQEDDVEAMVVGVVDNAVKCLVAGGHIHGQITDNLKKISQDQAMLDCMVSLKAKGHDFQSSKASLRSLSTSTVMQLQSFTSTTSGIPYLPPPLLISLLDIPPTQKGIEHYLRAIIDNNKSEIVLGNASASI